MAVARPGSIIGAISGNLGSQTFAHTRAGLIIKHRPLKTDKRTQAQLQHRALFQQILNSFQDLTDELYRPWRNLANQLTFTYRLHRRNSPSPWNLYLTVNLNSVLLGGTISGTCPRYVTPIDPYWMTFAFTAGGPYTVGAAGAPPNTPALLMIYGSRPMSTKPIQSYRSWRYLLPTGYVAIPRNIQTEWDAILGPPAAGEYVGIAIRGVDAYPWPGPPIIYTTEVLAP